MSASIEAIEDVSKEDQRGDIVAAIYTERLTLLTSLLEGALSSPNPPADQIARLVRASSGLLSSQALNPFDSLKTALTTGFHRPLFSVLFLVVEIMRQPSLSQSTLQLPAVSDINRALETTLRLAIVALKLLLTSPALFDPLQVDSVATEVRMAAALFQAIIRLPHAPAPTVWLAYCMEVDLIRIQLALIAQQTASFDSPDAAKSLPVIQSVLDLLLAISAFGAGAERLATEGFLMVATTCPLAALAEEGSIEVQNSSRPGERDPLHAIWCTTTAIVARIASHLEASSAFIAEVSGYVQLFRVQLSKSLKWSPSDALPLAYIEEMQTTVALAAILARRLPESEAFQSLLEDIWVFLNTLVYVIQHPSTVLSVIEPLSQRERAWLDKSTIEPIQNDSVGFGRRPSTGALIQTFMECVSFNRFVKSTLVRTDPFSLSLL